MGKVRGVVDEGILLSELLSLLIVQVNEALFNADQTIDSVRCAVLKLFPRQYLYGYRLAS